ncbi:MAG: Sensor histidine kinase [Caulobacteraceae bacterium]|nr:Sensor histidine kinase [Caulobacteraceae bacterium]
MTSRLPSLARRLVLLAAGWSLATLLVAGLALTLAFQSAAERRLYAILDDQIRAMQAVTNCDKVREIVPPVLHDDRLGQTFSGRYWVIDEAVGGRWREVARSVSMGDYGQDHPDGLFAPPPGGALAAARQPGTSIHYSAPGPDHQSLRVAAQQVSLQGCGAPVVFIAAEYTQPIRADARNFFTFTAATLLLLGAGLVIAVFVQVRIGLRPLFALRREVGLVRKGQAERLGGAYPVELAPLAEELNALLAHNQEVVERQRTHVGNLAHALKTPLSVMLAEAQRSKGPLPELVMRQAEIMRAQVDHHLRRARAAARSGGAGESTPLAPVLDELSRTLERIFRSKDIEVDWRCPDDLAFLGERQDLLELVGNVMENAAKWCAHRVHAEARPEGQDRLALVIEDDGPGLPEGKRAAVMRRGERLDESAPGSGLGLSIVDELARAYGGEVKLADADLGGLKVILMLPRV